MPSIPEHIIRKMFAEAESQAFGREVPEYVEFTEIVKTSNQNYLKNHPNAEVDSENRVLAEKHGAIRVGTVEEMHTVTRIFRTMGMHPVEFYDLTQLPKGALPMVATAFRPIDETIEQSAFRMFCSMLHPDYITDDIKEPVLAELSKRRKNNPKFSTKLLELLTISEKNGLNEIQAKEFVSEVVDSFRISKNRAIDFNLYKTLRLKNDVFADIVCLGININHLTPRAYDIKDAHERMVKLGLPMKDGGIEGPPMRTDGVIIQLNQTSRKAPGEDLFVSTKPVNNFTELKQTAKKISMNEGETAPEYLARIEEALKTENLVIIQHKARFGEIESRGVALTPKGETLYKVLLSENRFKKDFPKTHLELFEQELAYYTFAATEKTKNLSAKLSEKELVAQGFTKIIPQTYNDFLAASAAGIFKSNMTTGVAEGVDKNVQSQTHENKKLLENAMGTTIINRHDLHEKIKENSLKKIYEVL